MALLVLLTITYDWRTRWYWARLLIGTGAIGLLLAAHSATAILSLAPVVLTPAAQPHFFAKGASSGDSRSHDHHHGGNDRRTGGRSFRKRDPRRAGQGYDPDGAQLTSGPSLNGQSGGIRFLATGSMHLSGVRHPAGCYLAMSLAGRSPIPTMDTWNCFSDWGGAECALPGTRDRPNSAGCARLGVAIARVVGDAAILVFSWSATCTRSQKPTSLPATVCHTSSS